MSSNADLHLGDAFALLPGLRADLLLTDPPFNIGPASFVWPAPLTIFGVRTSWVWELRKEGAAPVRLRGTVEEILDQVQIDGVVLDPFMGHGRTGVACIKRGLKFIGIEIDPERFEVARKRIMEAG